MRKESRAMDSMWALEVMHKAHPEVCLSAVTRCAPDMQAIAKLDTAHSLFLDHHSGEIVMQDKGYAEFQSKLTPGVPTKASSEFACLYCANSQKSSQKRLRSMQETQGQ